MPHKRASVCKKYYSTLASIRMSSAFIKSCSAVHRCCPGLADGIRRFYLSAGPHVGAVLRLGKLFPPIFGVFVSYLSMPLRFCSSVRLTFAASLFLSIVAIWGAVTVPRDATLYFDAAQAFLDYGLGGAFEVFDWPWFSILLAVTHSLTGLSFENSGYLWCSLLMAGTCALLVDECRRWIPGSGYLACLVVLAIPGFNQYRSDILREFGFWFFCVLALWLVSRWRERPLWPVALLVQLSIILASAFRLEAFFLFPSLALWALAGRSWLRFQQLLLPMALGGALGLLALNISELSVDRLNYYQGLLVPDNLLQKFDQLAAHLANGMRFKYSRDDAGLILFLGILGTLGIGFFVSLGPLSLPILWTGKQAWVRLGAGVGQHYTWAGLGYFLVLLIFFIYNQFMVARYESLLSVLAAPLAIFALKTFVGQYTRLGRVLLIILVLTMLDNVISLSAKKTHFVEAGNWMAEHVPLGAPVYYDDVRISYYAGRGARRQALPRDVAMSPQHADNFRYFFIEIDENADEAWLQSWLHQHGRRILVTFVNDGGDTLLVIGD